MSGRDAFPTRPTFSRATRVQKLVGRFGKASLPEKDIARIASKAKSAQRPVRHMFPQGKVLKPRSEKFGVQQRLQGASLALLRSATRKHSGDEMVLIRETDQSETVLFRALGDARPINVRRYIRAPNFNQR